MDYGVKYNILVNGVAASQEFTKFADTISSMQPKIIKDISGINTTLFKTIRILKELDVLLKGPGGKRKLSIDTSETERELAGIKKQLASIKSKKITITTSSVSTTGVPTTSGAGARIGGRVPISRRAVASSFSPSKMMPTGFLAGIGLPMIAMGGMALAGRGIQTMVKDAALFEDTMTSVKNILKTGDKEAATFDERFASVSKTIQKVGVDTKFTSTEIAGAAKYLSMAGMSLSNVEAAMRPIANLAALSDAPIERVADTVTNIMAGFNIQADGIQGVSDIIAAASISTNTNVLEMAEAFKFAAGPLHLARIRFEEGAAAIGILANAGIKGTLAGTAIRAMMIRLIAPTTKAQKTLDRLGVSTTEVVNGVEKVKDISKIFQDLKKANATVEDLYKIFDKIGGNAATALYTYTERLVELTKAAEYSGGLAGFLAQEKMKTILGLTDQISSQIQYLSQTAFAAIEPVIKQYMNELMDWLKTPDALTFFENVADGIRNVTIAISELSRYIYSNWDTIKWLVGGALMAKGIFSVVSAIGSMTTAISAIGGAAAGSSVAVGGLAAGIVSLVSAPAVIITAILTAIGLLLTKVYQAKSESEELVKSMQVDSQFQTLDDMKAALDSIGISAKNAKEEVKDLVKERLAKKPTQGTMLGGFNQLMAESGYAVADLLMPGAGQALKNFDARTNVDLGIMRFGNAAEYKNEARNAAADLAKMDFNQSLGEFQKKFASSTAEERKSLVSKLIDTSFEYKGKKYPYIHEMDIVPGGTGSEQIRQTKDYSDRVSEIIKSQVEWANNIEKLTSSNVGVENLKAFTALGVTTGGGYESFKDVLTGDIEASKVQEVFQKLLGKHFLVDDIIRMFDNVGLTRFLKADPGQKFSPVPDITTGETPEEQLKRMMAEDRLSRGASGLSETGRISGSGAGKNITVNIQSLMSIEHANLEGKDLEDIKDKMAQALMDIVKEFEISYS